MRCNTILMQNKIIKRIDEYSVNKTKQIQYISLIFTYVPYKQITNFYRITYTLIQNVSDGQAIGTLTFLQTCLS